MMMMMMALSESAREGVLSNLHRFFPQPRGSLFGCLRRPTSYETTTSLDTKAKATVAEAPSFLLAEVGGLLPL